MPRRLARVHRSVSEALRVGNAASVSALCGMCSWIPKSGSAMSKRGVAPMQTGDSAVVP